MATSICIETYEQTTNSQKQSAHISNVLSNASAAKQATLQTVLLARLYQASVYPSYAEAISIP